MENEHHRIENDAQGNPWHVIDGAHTTNLGPLVPAHNTRIHFGPMVFTYEIGQAWVCEIHGEHVKTYVGSVPPSIMQALDKAGFNCSQVLEGFLQPLFMRVQTGAMKEGVQVELHKKYQWLIPEDWPDGVQITGVREIKRPVVRHFSTGETKTPDS